MILEDHFNTQVYAFPPVIFSPFLINIFCFSYLEFLFLSLKNNLPETCWILRATDKTTEIQR